MFLPLTLINGMTAACMCIADTLLFRLRKLTLTTEIYKQLCTLLQTTEQGRLRRRVIRIDPAADLKLSRTINVADTHSF